MARIIPAFSQFLDDNGEPLINGTLRFLESDTNNTDKPTYSDSAQTLPNTNPVQLSGAGRCSNVYGDGLYNIISYDEDDRLIEQFDPVGVDTVEGPFSDWNSVVIYSAGAIATASNGSYYRAITGTNQNNEPSANPNDWEQINIIGDWNSVISYSADDAVYGSDGDLYFSIAGSNLNNDPTTSSTLWRFGSLSIAASGTDTYTATLGITTYTINKRYNLTFANTNTSTTPTLNIDSLGAKTIVDASGLVLTAGELSGAVVVEYNGTNMVLLNSNLDNAISRFSSGIDGSPSLALKVLNNNFPSDLYYFGTGSDGAGSFLSSANLSSGEYHYTSLNIGSGATLGISDTEGHLILRCTGAVTITGTISADGKGAIGGVAVTSVAGEAGANGFLGGGGGSGGNDGYDSGAGGEVLVRGNTVSGGAIKVGVGAGSNGAALSLTRTARSISAYSNDLISGASGGGGGGAGTGGAFNAGNGGRGAGYIIIIANAIVFNSGAVITADGNNGSNSANDAGGGGGGGGLVLLAAKTITNSGTITTTGGGGGTGIAGYNGGAGGAGHSTVITLG